MQKFVTSKWSIRVQLTVGIALVHTVLMSIFVFDVANRQTDTLYQESVEHACALAMSLAANSIPWILANDIVGLEEVVQAQHSYPQLNHALVQDNAGKVLGFSQRQEVGRYLTDSISQSLSSTNQEVLILINNQHQIDVAVAIKVNGEKIGWSRISLHRNKITSNIHAIYLDGVLYTVVAVLLGIGFAVTMGIQLTRRLNNLAEIAKKIKAGHFGSRAEIQQQDEIGRLASAFNEMLNSLKLAQREVVRNEQLFKGIYENSVVSVWSEDFSYVKNALELLRSNGITDLEHHLKHHPEVTLEIAYLIKVNHVNGATLSLFEAKSLKMFLAHLPDIFNKSSLDVFAQQFCAIWRGDKVFTSEMVFLTLNDQTLQTIVTFQIPEVSSSFKNIPVTVIDMTERKALENQLLQAQKMESMGQLTGGIAHDFNNLLAVISGNNELAKMAVDNNSETIARLDNIAATVDRAASLTERLLSFSSQQTLSVQVLNINDLIRSLKEMLERTIGENIELHTQLDKLEPTVSADKHQLENVLLNLSLNSRDAMSSGGRLTIETIVEKPPKSPLEMVRVRVIDTGEGIEQAHQNSVFEPFFTTKPVGSGSGLGLSMVYGFVKQSGGSIAIKSELSVGTEITFTLPVSNQTSKVHNEDMNNSIPEVEPTRPTKILIVEDDDQVREVPATILAKSGYQILQASNGDEAIVQLKENGPFDLLFTDVILSGRLNGVEVSQLALKIQPNIKVLFTTGYAENNVAAKGELVPGVNLIKKPYRSAALLSLIECLL